MMDTLTVIIPVFNRASVVERTLASVFSQRRLPDRLIVVDNGSTDDSREVVARWLASHSEEAERMGAVIVDQPSPGACAARNRGLALVDTDWVMFFDSDDEMLPGHLERAMRVASENPEAEIVGWDVDQQLPDGSRRTGRFLTEDMLTANLIHAVMATQRYMARTALFRKVGGWNPEVMKWNDWELGVRLLLENPVAVKATGENTVVMNFTRDSITGTTVTPGSCVRSIDTVEADLRRAGRTDLLPWIAYRRAILAARCQDTGFYDEADKILADTMRGVSLRMRLAIRLTFLHARFIGRGAHYTFRLLAPV